VTDRFEGVPKELRAKFITLKKQAEKRASSLPKVAEAAPAPTPAAAPAPETTAYQRLVEREAAEKDIKARASALLANIGGARRAQIQLTEERANLAANPLLNAAQPVRVQRMQTIDEELKALEKDVATNLNEVSKLLEEAKTNDYPEAWVTGY
jgi:hypothetical protein